MNVYKGDIVISGVGGYFPKAKNIEQFKQKLLDQEFLLESRWRDGLLIKHIRSHILQF